MRVDDCEQARIFVSVATMTSEQLNRQKEMEQILNQYGLSYKIYQVNPLSSDEVHLSYMNIFRQYSGPNFKFPTLIIADHVGDLEWAKSAENVLSQYQNLPSQFSNWNPDPLENLRDQLRNRSGPNSFDEYASKDHDGKETFSGFRTSNLPSLLQTPTYLEPTGTHQYGKKLDSPKQVQSFIPEGDCCENIEDRRLGLRKTAFIEKPSDSLENPPELVTVQLRKTKFPVPNIESSVESRTENVTSDFGVVLRATEQVLEKTDTSMETAQVGIPVALRKTNFPSEFAKDQNENSSDFRSVLKKVSPKELIPVIEEKKSGDFRSSLRKTTSYNETETDNHANEAAKDFRSVLRKSKISQSEPKLHTPLQSDFRSVLRKTGRSEGSVAEKMEQSPVNLSCDNQEPTNSVTISDHGDTESGTESSVVSENTSKPSILVQYYLVFMAVFLQVVFFWRWFQKQAK